MNKSFQKWIWIVSAALLLLAPGLLSAQQLTQSQIEELRRRYPNQQITQEKIDAVQRQLPPQQLSPQQIDSFNRLSPAQQAAMNEEIAKTGGNLTPEAMEALKNRPEFQDLKPEDIVKGKEILEKQEAAKKEAVKKEAEKARLLGEAKEPEKKTAGPEATLTEKLEKALEPQKAEAERKVIEGEAKYQSLYERSREIRKYQDISLDLKPFGYDFFRDAAVKLTTDRRDIPVPLKYVVGPGDEVKLALWGRMNASYTLIVDRDGKINIPNIGPLVVAGMTFEQMSGFLIKQAEQITGTNVDISMGALRTIPVFILGDIRRPGAYTISAFATITDALLLAGGPTEIGSMRKIQLKRKEAVVQTFDLYDLLLKGDKSKDVTLRAGDIVFVPVIGSYVGVAGNVKRPALYEMKENPSLEQLFDLAGGLVPTAYTQQIQVERTIKNEKQIVIDIDDKNLSRVGAFQLQDADLVKVFSIVEKDMNIVTLQGNVKKGGKYALKPGMRLGDLLNDPLLDLLPETYFDYALIKRQNPPSMETQLIPFNLGDLLVRRDPASNLELRPLDTIYIFSQWFFKDKPFFTVGGEVRKPGRFDLSENFRVKDAILAAGDVTKDAYLKKGEIVRVNRNKEYRTIYVNLARAMADDPAENLPLEDEDQVVVHSLYEEQWKEMVSVTGEVKKPGNILLTEKMRVSDLIFKAGGQTRDTLLDQAELYRTDWKTKEVTLKKINLGSALAGDPAENLELRDLDRLIVHSVWETVFKKTVAVDGDVLKPGVYQMAERMTVRDLVFAAGNLLESASTDTAELSSQVMDRNNHAAIVHRQIDLARALAGDPEQNVILSPFDRLFVRRIPDWNPEKFVTVAGEFRFPGRYIIRKGERLSSVIERAGGYKENAYLRGAFFTRERVREMQQKSLAEMADRMERDLLAGSSGLATALSAEEVAGKKAEMEQKLKFIDTLRKLKATGRMTIYLGHMRLLKGSPYDIELEGGDSLLIPQKNSVVGVVGAVMTQASLIYSDKMSYQDYIDESGGYASFADEKKVFVMKVDGSARKLSRGFLSWNAPRERWEIVGFAERIAPIEPGDTIVVPEKVDRIAWLREIRDITQILMNVAVAAGVVIALY